MQSKQADYDCYLTLLLTNLNDTVNKSQRTVNITSHLQGVIVYTLHFAVPVYEKTDLPSTLFIMISRAWCHKQDIVINIVFRNYRMLSSMESISSKCTSMVVKNNKNKA